MKVKKLLNYIVYGLMLTALVTVATMVAIMASTQQNINSSITVTYKPIEVDGTASAKYYVGTSDGVDLKNGTETVLDFKPGESAPADGYKLNQVEDVVNLSEGEAFVVYEYKFTNRGDNPYVVDFKANLTKLENVAMQTYVSEIQMTDRAAWTSVSKTDSDGTGTFKFIVAPNTTETGEGTCYAYIRFKLNDTEAKADVEGSFTINLYGSGVELKKLFNYDATGNTVTGLSSEATNLNNLVFPNNITAINGTFGGDSITSVHIGKQLSTISSGAFSGLTNLREVTVDNQDVYESISDTNSLMTNVNEEEFVLRALSSLSGNTYLTADKFDITNGTPYNTYTIKPNPELWLTNKFNKKSLNNLLKQITNKDTASVTNMGPVETAAKEKMTSADFRNNNGGQDITVTLGGYTWSATYLSTDINGDPILTLWFGDSSQLNGKTYDSSKSAFGSTGTATWSSGWYSSSTSVDYPSAMYGTSYMSAVVLNNGGQYAHSTSNNSSDISLIPAEQNEDSAFALFTMDEFGLTNYLVTPEHVDWQKSGQKAKEQLGNYNGSSSYNLPNENWGDINVVPNDGFYSSSYNYANKGELNSAWKDDYLWLPSLTETGYSDSLTGMWETSTEQRKNTTTSWLRSGTYNIARSAYTLTASGGAWNDNSVVIGDAVRPALHLNLKSAAGTITAAAASEASEVKPVEAREASPEAEVQVAGVAPEAIIIDKKSLFLPKFKELF